MSKLTLFYLENCPYCRNAKKAVRELCSEQPAYAAAEIDWVEESRQPALAAQYDYYYVPAVFLGEKKLYEATPGESYEACKAQLAAALEKALQQP